MTQCPVCGIVARFRGYFCSSACDELELRSRFAHRIAEGLRRLAGRGA